MRKTIIVLALAALALSACDTGRPRFQGKITEKVSYEGWSQEIDGFNSPIENEPVYLFRVSGKALTNPEPTCTGEVPVDKKTYDSFEVGDPFFLYGFIDFQSYIDSCE